MGALIKGCRNCENRKAKCDGELPSFTRCLNMGIDFVFHAQHLRFVNENPRIRRSVAVGQAQLEEASMRSKSGCRFNCSKPTPRSRMVDPYSAVTKEIPLVAFKDNILMSFLAFKLLGRSREGDDCQYSLQCGLPTIWLAKKPHENQHKSWHTLAAIVFGQAHTLSDIRSELSTAERHLSDETLASMTALYMYEILVSKTERAWMSHVNGIGVLLELRGWKINHISSTNVSSKSYLENRPWEDDPASKPHIDYLVDIGADVAISIEELNTWWRQWEAEHPHAATVTSTANSPLFPIVPEYDTLWEAFTICFHNATRILLLQLWGALKPFSTFHSILLDEQNSTALLGITSNLIPEDWLARSYGLCDIAIGCLVASFIRLAFWSFRMSLMDVLIGSLGCEMDF
ncbi:hypothetical protein DL95DRAFT_450493 [Leptodontidium sp. 2 PMI_412]|nr:hypothetical protein DL95DRAFT_450493 [Leptodontidium sp. 2 PMI_412]